MRPVLTRERAEQYARTMAVRTGQTYYVAETVQGRWVALTRAQYIRNDVMPYVSRISLPQPLQGGT